MGIKIDKVYVFKHGKVRGDYDLKKLKEYEHILGEYIGEIKKNDRQQGKKDI